tara:strand:+ start:86 stop:481 length:396 start_codon:yes stop_codon:yes gene_type:complete
MKNVFVILGYKLKKNSKISNILKSRLDKGIEKYKKKDIIIVCGGNISNQKHTEAYAMKKYLIKENIPEKYILKESKSISTKENIKFLSTILSKKKIYKFSIISSKTHIPIVKNIIENVIFYYNCEINYISV